MLIRLCGVLCLSLTILAGCGRERSSPPVTGPGAAQNVSNDADVQTTTAPRQTPQERAAIAKDALFNELSTQLLAAMSSGGPAKAIEICSKLAPKLAREVGEQHHVLIGRTAVRLRNASNLPPEWAESLLPDLPTKPVFKELEDGRTGALFPILLKVQCLTCHGPPEKIASEIRTELARLYPNDKATGFQEGDLRGWFWVEVPADGDNATKAAREADAN